LNARALVLILLLAAACGAVARDEDALVRYRVEGDAIPTALTAVPGDAARGTQVIKSRDSNCLLCHVVPGGSAHVMGNVGPPLAAVGARLTAGQLRLRIADSTRLSPDSVMPAYYRIGGLRQVAQPYRGKPVLTAQQVEDVVAYLASLK
jgi:sulfur-oxidizing protein SoxX